MIQKHRSGGLARNLTGAALAVLVAATAACGAEGGTDDYANEGDTGAAAPAHSPDSSTARMIGPDSSLGTQGRTGMPGVAGDTQGSRGTPAGRPTPPPR